MSTHILPRSGATPVEFDGDLIASGGLRPDFDFEFSPRGKPIGIIQRGHRLELYRTASGKLVLSIAFRSAWPNEPEYAEVHILRDLPQLWQALGSYRAERIMNQYVGPPAGSFNAIANREGIVKAYTLQFDSAATELLAEQTPERID